MLILLTPYRSQEILSATRQEGLVWWLVRRRRRWWWQEGTRALRRRSHQSQVGGGKLFLLRQGPEEMGQQKGS